MLLLSLAGRAATNDAPFQEIGGLVVVEFESIAPGGLWKLENSLPGAVGSGYLRWDGPNLANQAGQGVFGVNVEIHQAGQYHLRIHNHHAQFQARRYQDLFTRVDGGPWKETFSPPVANWSWPTFFGNSASSQVASVQLTAGIHRIEFSGRSKSYTLDRLHLFIPGHPNAFNKATPESSNDYVNHGPQAAFTITPPELSRNDHHSLVITLDASGSVDPNTWQDLRYNWAIPGAHFVQGTRANDRVAKITLAGGHALPVRLFVSDTADSHLYDVAYGVVNVLGSQGRLGGEMAKWHTMRLRFEGSQLSEEDTNPNPFVDLRLNVTFTGPDGVSVLVPGFFNGDGNGSGTGKVWQANFAPDQPGLWSYKASFRQGQNISVSLAAMAGSPLEFDGASGQFQVLPRDARAPGFLSKGRLEYVNGHYLKHADGGYFIKGGTNSPENLLGYKGFDDISDAGGIGILHEYPDHVEHWEAGDPVFRSNNTGVSSKGLIGALNYLHSQHVNSIFFLPMNLGGDGQDTHPFLGTANTNYNKRHYDISRMAQWSLVFQHAQEKGIMLHVVLGETETDNENWLSNGVLGLDRKLFYRELIARFSNNLGIKWNLSEENDFNTASLLEFASYINALDPYDHPIAVHTHANNFQDYYPLLGSPLFSSTSIQFDPNLAQIFVETWRAQSSANGRKWVIDMDEVAPALIGLTDSNSDDLRKRVLYDVYFSGGQVEWYFGYHELPLGGDLRCEDFRTRSDMWEYMWFARNFMQTYLPFWEMEPQGGLVTEESGDFGGAEVFAKLGEIYAVYFPNVSAGGILDLSHTSGSFSTRWFSPRTGSFILGSTVIQGGGPVQISPPGFQNHQDWVLLVERK